MRWEKYRSPAVFALALIFPALVFRAHMRGQEKATLIDNAVLLVTAPIHELFVSMVGFTSDTWHHYIYLVGSAERSAELHQQVRRLEQQVMALQILELENEHLRALLRLEGRNRPDSLLSARIVGAGLGPAARVLRINRGALQGLERGAAVVTPQGLVGRLLAVGWSTAEVQLLTDPRLTVPVRGLRSGARGRLSFDLAEGALVVSEILRSDDLRPGDAVVTSGLGEVYPPDIPVGVVLKVVEEPGKIHRKASVRAHVAFEQIQWVSVLEKEQDALHLETPESLLPAELRLPESP